MTEFNPHTPEIKCAQDDENTFCFSSLTLALFYSSEYVAEQARTLRLNASLSCESRGINI